MELPEGCRARPRQGRREERAVRKGYRSVNRAMPLRFATLLLSMLYTRGAPRLGVEPGTVLMVLWLAGAFMGVDTLRPSGLVKE